VHDDVRARIRELAQRAGLHNIPSSALAAGVAVCAVALAAAIWHWWPSRSPAADLTVSPGSVAPRLAADVVAGTDGSREGAESASIVATATVFVHVVGAVARPGLYGLAAGSRVADAIAGAGGLLGSAEERAVNLARQLTDGEQIVIPTSDEVAEAGGFGATPMVAGGPSSPPGGSPAGSSAPVDINSADAAALDTLPGIGPSTAAKIVADREANGPFASPEDLGRVSGIGPKKLETLIGLIVAR